MLKQLLRTSDEYPFAPSTYGIDFNATSDSTVDCVYLTADALGVDRQRTIAIQWPSATRRKELNAFTASRASRPTFDLGFLRRLDDWVVETADWRELVGYGAPWQAILTEIQWFAAQRDGWKGPNSKRIKERTVKDATLVVRALSAQVPNGSHPMVGADEEGALVFTWDDGILIGNLSLRGNGKYSYFIKKGVSIVKNSGQLVSAPLPADLTEVLAS